MTLWDLIDKHPTLTGLGICLGFILAYDLGFAIVARWGKR